MAQSTIKTRLCPQCANSIAVDALTCPYCKADLILSLAPEWPEQQRASEDSSPIPRQEKLPLRSKVILVLGLLLFALGVYLVGGNRERNDLTPVLAEQEKALKEKEEKIKGLEAQVAQLRQEQQGTTGQIDELKNTLAANQKDLAATKKRLTDASREIDRLAASRVTAAPRSGGRTAEQLPPPPASTASSRRPAEAGTYETLRPTTVYEEPSNSGRAVAQIGRGTEVTVIRSVGEWLEVRSKHGKPPGYIRSDDARLLSRAN